MKSLAGTWLFLSLIFLGFNSSSLADSSCSESGKDFPGDLRVQQLKMGSICHLMISQGTMTNGPTRSFVFKNDGTVNITASFTGDGIADSLETGTWGYVLFPRSPNGTVPIVRKTPRGLEITASNGSKFNVESRNKDLILSSQATAISQRPLFEKDNSGSLRPTYNLDFITREERDILDSEVWMRKKDPACFESCNTAIEPNPCKSDCRKKWEAPALAAHKKALGSLIQRFRGKLQKERSEDLKITHADFLLLDNGFSLGNIPNSYAWANSTFRDPDGNQCVVQNKEIYKPLGGGEVALLPDAKLFTFLTKRCRTLNPKYLTLKNAPATPFRDTRSTQNPSALIPLTDSK